MHIIIAYALRIIVVYATISHVEYMAHRHLMHRMQLANFFRSRRLEEVFKEHIEHHFKCYDVFNHEEGACGLLNLGVKSTTELTIVVVPGLIALYFDWITAVIFLVAALVHGVLWSAVHTEMHRNEGTWFSRTSIFQALARHHFLHHRHPKKNYNALFLGWDLILRTHVRATDDDRKEMEKEHWRVRPLRTKRV
jgi:hypothetical protein